MGIIINIWSCWECCLNRCFSLCCWWYLAVRCCVQKLNSINMMASCHSCRWCWIWWWRWAFWTGFLSMVFMDHRPIPEPRWLASITRMPVLWHYVVYRPACHLHIWKIHTRLIQPRGICTVVILILSMVIIHFSVHRGCSHPGLSQRWMV